MKLENAIIRAIYWPLCRFYARRLGDSPADRLLRFLCAIQFRRSYGFWPSFVEPRRFSEKVWSRQLYDRDPRFTLVSDKVLVRDYVAKRIGSEYLIPLLWYGKSPEEIPFERLPAQFVIKANHGCDYNIIVHDKRSLSRGKTIATLNRWLTQNFGEDYCLGIAWGYKHIERRILVEQLLQENGRVPTDYKFFCFSGKMEYFKMDFARFEDHATQWFDRKLNRLTLVEIGLKVHDREVRLPENLRDMVQVAENLATGFDFIRVDLYHLGSRIYFSELTPYPGGVATAFSDERYDREFGEKWQWFGPENNRPTRFHGDSNPA